MSPRFLRIKKVDREKSSLFYVKNSYFCISYIGYIPVCIIIWFAIFPNGNPYYEMNDDNNNDIKISEMTNSKQTSFTI